MIAEPKAPASAAPTATGDSALRRFYRTALQQLVRFHVRPGARVLEIGCGDGELLAALGPERGIGVDQDAAAIERGRKAYPHLELHVGDAATFEPEGDEELDYILLANVVADLSDVQGVLSHVASLCSPHTRVVLTSFNYLWQPLVAVTEWLGLKPRQRAQSWLTPEQLAQLCDLSGLEPVTHGRHLLLPAPLPGLEPLANGIVGALPLVNALCLNEFLVARPEPQGRKEYSVSVIVACKDEAGNVSETIRSVPRMGLGTELLFVDGHSSDGTVEEIERNLELNPDLDRVRVMVQDGTGKADAVRKGFDAATGDILMILDADNTVPGSELPKFYDAIATGRGEFINGSRLVFPMEDQAMRHLNLVANHIFGRTFAWLLGQEVSDTLCGTKVLFRRDWERIKVDRKRFGEDPFGDFDLLFGAARASLRIREIPIRYRARTYGDIKIDRFRNGLQLLRMVGRGFLQLKRP